MKKETSRKELEKAQLRMKKMASNVEMIDLDDTEKFKNLKNSMLSYKNGSSFCRYCSKSFTSKSELISHIRICFSIDNNRDNEGKKRYAKRTAEIVILDEEKLNPDSKKPKTDQLIEISDEENEISDDLGGISDEDRETSDDDREASDEDRETSDDDREASDEDKETSDEERETSDEKRENSDTGNIGIEQTCEMDKVSLLKRTANSVVLALPHGWKKFCLRRQNTDRWDFYLLSSDNKRFRSTVEVKRYLENNPSVKCDISVTNTKCPSILKKLQKLNPDSKEHKTDQVLEESEISDEERKTSDEERKSPCEKREISDEENETSVEKSETSDEESETSDEEKSKMEQLHSEVTSEPFEFDNSSEDEMC